MSQKLINVAKDAGADAVKFQTFHTEEVVTKTAEKAQEAKKFKIGMANFSQCCAYFIGMNNARQGCGQRPTRTSRLSAPTPMAMPPVADS
jgi:hypothetical protein